MNFDKIHFGELSVEVHSSAPSDPNRKKEDSIFFSSEARYILKFAVEISDELNSKFVMPQHIALAVFQSKDSNAYQILQKFDIDVEKIVQNLFLST